MKEAGVLFDRHGIPLHWHMPAGRTGAFLPDSTDFWDVIWGNRHNLSGFAHSHPGSGTVGPSYEDITTFRAIEKGLGRKLDWWIINEDEACLVHLSGDKVHVIPVYVTPHWMATLRALSNYKDQDNFEEETRVISSNVTS